MADEADGEARASRARYAAETAEANGTAFYPWDIKAPVWEEEGSTAVMLDVSVCPRCGGKHRLVFHPMRKPIPSDVEGSPSWTHWAMCPSGHGPILNQREKYTCGNTQAQSEEQGK
jgi:hypothetical protein